VRKNMKLIDVDSKATLEDFLTLKKRLNLYSFYGNVMKKSVVTRMSLRSDKILTRKLYLVAVRNSVLYNIINQRDFYLI
jgi:hypothetical protein